jgi:hypothetical protein
MKTMTMMKMVAAFSMAASLSMFTATPAHAMPFKSQKARKGLIKAAVITGIAGSVLVGGTVGSYKVVNGIHNENVDVATGVDQARGNMSASYAKQYDVLTNLANAWRGSANFEGKVKPMIAEAQNAIRQSQRAVETGDPAAVAKADQIMVAAMRPILSLQPAELKDLQAVKQAEIVMKAVQDHGDEVKAERMRFNDAVRKNNKTLQNGTNSIVNSFWGKFDDRVKSYEAPAGTENAPQLNMETNIGK